MDHWLSNDRAAGHARTAREILVLSRRASGLGPDLQPLLSSGMLWARTMVLSRIRYSKSGSSAMAAKMRCQTAVNALN
jgi:hypothetical protein